MACGIISVYHTACFLHSTSRLRILPLPSCLLLALEDGGHTQLALLETLEDTCNIRENRWCLQEWRKALGVNSIDKFVTEYLTGFPAEGLLAAEGWLVAWRLEAGWLAADGWLPDGSCGFLNTTRSGAAGSLRCRFAGSES